MIPIKQFFAWFKNVAKFGTSFRDCYIAAADADIDGIPYTLAPEFTQSGKPETFEVQS